MALGGREATVIAGAAILLGALLALVLVVIVYRSQPEAPRRGIAGLNADVVQLIAAHLDEASLRSAHAASRELRDASNQLSRPWSVHKHRLGKGVQDGRCSIGPDGATVAVGDARGRVCLRDAATGGIVRCLRDGGAAVTAVRYSPDGTVVAVGTVDGAVEFLASGGGGATIAPPQDRHAGEVTSLDFRADGRRAVSGSRDTNTRVWDVSTGRSVRSFSDYQARPSADRSQRLLLEINSVSMDPEGNRVAIVTFHGGLAVLSVATGSSLWNAEVHKMSPKHAVSKRSNAGNEPTSVTFSPDGGTVAVGAEHGLVVLADSDTGRVRQVLDHRPHMVRVLTVCFSPDGTLVASGDDEGTVRLWDATTGVPERSLRPRIGGEPIGAVRTVDIVTDPGKQPVLFGASYGAFFARTGPLRVERELRRQRQRLLLG